MSDDNDSPEIPQTDRPTLWLLDGHALVYRAFYAMISRPLRTSYGLNTNAPFGLARFLDRLMENHQPDYLAVAFDAGHSQREELYPEYKATREKMPDELKASLPYCLKLVEAFGVPAIRKEGWEADDLLGTLAQQAAREDMQAIIVSGDKDLYQLVDEHVWLLNPGRGGPGGVDQEWVTPDNAGERLGVPPEHITDYLALVGDSSDNVPGVRGIGKKTAPKLIEEFGQFENILDHQEEISSTRARNALAEHGEEGKLSKRLVTIRRDAPVELDRKRLQAGQPDRQKLHELFEELEFGRLAEKYAGQAEARDDIERDYELIQDPDRLLELVDRLHETDGRVALDTETTGLDPMRARLVGISLADRPGRAYYLPVDHRVDDIPRDGDGNPTLGLGQSNDEDNPQNPNLPGWDHPAMQALQDWIENPDTAKVAQNGKYDQLILQQAGIQLRGLDFDPSIAHYLLHPEARSHGLDDMVQDRWGTTLISFEEICGSGQNQKTFDQVPPDQGRDYAAEDADYTLRLAEILEEELEEEGLLDLFYRLEMPLVGVLVACQRRGIKLDVDFLDEFSQKLRSDLDEIEAEILQEAGLQEGQINLRSVPQLRELLFEQLDLEVIKRTKTGPSTDKEVLNELAGRGHKVPRLILEYRELEKLRSTYVDALPELVHPETGRVHTSFNQTVASTGRLSSSDPNLQNIPIRTDRGRQIRKAFVAEPGWKLLGADYSQVELRVLAHLSQDPAFLEAFRAGRDIHRETAARIFDVELESVTPEQRDRAKTINFATIYGQGPQGLASQLGISVEEAKEFIENYFQRFDRVQAYLEDQQEKAREQGYVETLTGRRRYVPEIRSKNPGVRGFGERVAGNMPIQGTAADIIKRAMIELEDDLNPDQGRQLLQVHDELILEVREDAVEAVGSQVRDIMEEAAQLDVPLVVDMDHGDSWYDAKA